ncbi:MAG TPA: ATP-binding cassette domain-containing protein [Candidatus Aquilonibacter sp.]|nr:ATP-binding cassette domain-containing protein [Candidatus Aquilonibacter sp.]
MTDETPSTGCLLTARTVPYHHHLRFECTLGNLHLHVGPAFEHPWSILFGPSGSGKSSILRALCGLLPNAHARVFRGDPPGEHNIDLTPLPPHHRAIAYAPQQPSLFPHLTVRDNIAFSHTIRSRPSSPVLEDVLSLFELHPLLDRNPNRLSGGERQRVNLARAFAVPDAKLMLLDEPFTGLDLALRDQLLPRMKDFLAARNIPCISVTHDVDEALLLDAQIFHIDAGRITMHGPARAVLAAERERLLNALR